MTLERLALPATIAAMIVLASTIPSRAQIENQLKAYTGTNATGYLKPLADAFGADLNDGLFNSAYVPTSGFHLNIEFRMMSVIFGTDDETFLASTEGNFTPARQVIAPTVVGPGDAKIAIGDGGTSFAFPGGFSLHSFALAVPQVRISSLGGTEALVRYFAVNTGDVEIGDIKLVGFGIRHNLSQHFPAGFPLDLAAGFFYQSFSLGGDLISSSALSFGVQAGRRLKSGFIGMEPYAGLSVDRFAMNVNYKSESTGTPIDVELIFPATRTVHLTLGLSLDFAILDFNAEYNIAAQRSFSLGLAFGN